MHDEPETEAGDKVPPRGRRALRASDLVLGAAVGSLLALVAIVGLIVVSRRQVTPSLTAESLRSARQRWQTSGTTDYRMEITVTGRQPSRYHVQVADGNAVMVQRDNHEIPRRNRPYWTVPGLFEIIEHDVDCADDPTNGFGARPGSTAVLRADFDQRLGYPRKFERLILGEPQLDMTWQVTKFEEGVKR